jgi:hypothetical protein
LFKYQTQPHPQFFSYSCKIFFNNIVTRKPSIPAVTALSTSQDLEDSDASYLGNGFTEEQDEVPDIIETCDNKGYDSLAFNWQEGQGNLFATPSNIRKRGQGERSSSHQLQTYPRCG